MVPRQTVERAQRAGIDHDPAGIGGNAALGGWRRGGGRRAPRQDAAHLIGQGRWIERLDQDVGGAEAAQPRDLRGQGRGGQKHDGHVCRRRMPPERLENLSAVEIRQPDVEQHHIDWSRCGRAQGLESRCRLPHAELAALLQRDPGDGADVRIVIDEQCDRRLRDRIPHLDSIRQLARGGRASVTPRSRR